jgi:hypothetical protein
MLKISAGNEEFGLCGKWLLHGFKITKLNLQGNPRLMQRSLYIYCRFRRTNTRLRHSLIHHTLVDGLLKADHQGYGMEALLACFDLAQ